MAMRLYFQEYYVNLVRGVSYVPTQLATVLAVLFLLNDTRRTARGIAARLAEGFVCFAIVEMMSAVFYALFGDFQMEKIIVERIILAVFIILYACVRSKYTRPVRVIYSMVFYAGKTVIFSIGEPLGTLFSQIDSAYWSWAQHLTWISEILMMFVFVWWIRRFTAKKSGTNQTLFTVLLCVISLMIVISQIVYIAFSGVPDYPDIPLGYKQYNMVVSAFLLMIEMLTYYLYYSVSKLTWENESLLTMRHKAELEVEKFQANRVNYDDLRSLRHELKNHNFYMISLLEAKKYDELEEYLKSVATSAADHLQSFDCGNYMVDVVMNHAMNEARQRGVTVSPQIVVPRELPFEEADMCSLLSNLLDNAIEAAAQSGAEHPSVEISILPRQDYLFLHVANDVNDSIPAQQRLTLKTTKKQFSLHGYGTKIIRAMAEKYHGSVKFDMADGRFVVDVMIELPHESMDGEAVA